MVEAARVVRCDFFPPPPLEYAKGEGQCCGSGSIFDGSGSGSCCYKKKRIRILVKYDYIVHI